MSLILEALRKSEAERRRGLPPDLRHELPPASAPVRRAFPAWAWVIAGFGGLALAWALWPDPAAPIGNVADAPEPAVTEATPAAAQPLPSASVPASGASQPTLPAPATAPAPPSQPAADAMSAPAPAAASPPPAPLEPVAPPPPARASAVIPAAATGAETRQPPPSPTTTASAAGTAGTVNGAGRPPLKMSMHMWNEDPARRFAIIDGKRVGEGDRVGDGTVTRIDADGVVLDWNGSEIRIPLR